MIRKLCPICQKELKTDDVVVVLMLAKITLKEEAYDLACMSQTIASHLFCAENKPVIVANNAEEPK